MDKSAPKPAAPSSPATDDRPLVAGDALADSADWSDRLLLWWDDNRAYVGGAVAAVLIGVVGWQSAIYVQDKRERGLQTAFAGLVEPSELLAFAEAHASHPLAGTAHLRLADLAYADGRYAEAATRYTSAVQVLAGTPFAARARLGNGMALLLDGRSAEGEAVLEAIRQDVAVPATLRAEAGYQLAIRQWEAERTAAARSTLQWVAALEGAGFWGQRAQSLLDEQTALR